MLKAIPQQELIDQNRAKHNAPRIGQAFGRDLPMAIEHAFELFIEVLNCHRAQFVEDPADLYTRIGMRIPSIQQYS